MIFIKVGRGRGVSGISLLDSYSRLLGSHTIISLERSLVVFRVVGVVEVVEVVEARGGLEGLTLCRLIVA